MKSRIEISRIIPNPKMVPLPTEIVIRRKPDSQKLPSRDDESREIPILGTDWEGGESGVG